MSTYAMHVAKTGLNSQQTKMQIIANNLANGLIIFSLLLISFKIILFADFGPRPGSLENFFINSSISGMLLFI